MTKLVDQYGRPIRPRAITREFAAPTFAGHRTVWSDSILAGMTPMELAGILRDASQGYPDRFFTLAEEMEERDLHYAAVLGTRKRAITGIEPIIVAASEDSADEKLADEVRRIVEEPEFVDNYLTELLDALGKGYSIVETIWERSARQFEPVRFERRDQRHFLIDRTDGRTLRMKDELTTEGIDLPPYQFSIHRPRLKSGLPIRSGLARLSAWAFLFKNYTIKDWMSFLEVFGMPIRVGKYGQGSSQAERKVLLQAVRDLSIDAAAIIPKEMEIEFVEAKGGSGGALFDTMAGYLDRQVSKGVLGQTMTTDDGSSLSQAAIHENVRFDIARADARQTAITANRDLIRPFVDLNFGPQGRYPTLVIPITENEDIKALADVLSTLVPLGLEVGMQDVRERIGFEDPEPEDVLLRPGVAVKPDEADDKDEEKGDDTTRERCPSCGGSHALAADQTPELDALLEDGLEDWQQQLEPFVKPLRTLFEEANNYDELVKGLEAITTEMDAGPLADALAALAMKARGLGDIGNGD